ncbi:unnamed protein product, partial [Phaeothamnion confervicola]
EKGFEEKELRYTMPVVHGGAHAEGDEFYEVKRELAAALHSWGILHYSHSDTEERDYAPTPVAPSKTRHDDHHHRCGDGGNGKGRIDAVAAGGGDVWAADNGRPAMQAVAAATRGAAAAHASASAVAALNRRLQAHNDRLARDNIRLREERDAARAAATDAAAASDRLRRAVHELAIAARAGEDAFEAK